MTNDAVGLGEGVEAGLQLLGGGTGGQHGTET